MPSRTFFLIALSGAVLLAACGRGGDAFDPSAVVATPGHPEARKIPGWIVVDFVDGTTKAEFDAWEAEWGIDLEFNSKVGPRSGVTTARVTGDKWALIERIRSHPAVEAAEPLYEYRHKWEPNDPDWRHQWHMRKAGAPEAWERTTGRGVVVAVIDTGIAYADHERFRQVEDLAGVRFVPGWDFVNGRRLALDDHGHGTHVAGTIAQATNNGRGVAGLAHGASLMPLKVLSARGSGTSADIADAIRFAADNGAHVINLSLGGGMPSGVMARAVAHARRKGVVVVAAAGNSGTGRVSYPAAYPGVIAVSATRYDDALAPYSSYGKQVALAAPGGDMTVDQDGDGKPDGVLQNTIVRGDPSKSTYAYFQGTSMASPHVAAAAALVMSMGITRPDAVERVLFGTARKAPGQTAWNERHGHGVLDAGAAVKQAYRDLAVGRASWAGGLLALLLLLLRRRLPPVAPTPALVGMLLLTAVGLFFLPWILPHFAGREVLTRPLMDWGLAAFGPGRHANPLSFSVALPLVLSVMLFTRAKLRPALAGLCLGVAAYLFHAAFTGHVAVRWLPGLLGDGWLVANGLVAFALAFAFSRKEARAWQG
jgi:serine protease